MYQSRLSYRPENYYRRRRKVDHFSEVQFSSPSWFALVAVIAVRIMMRVVVYITMMVVVVVMVAVVVVMMRLVVVLIIVVSFRHRTQSNSDTKRKKGYNGGFHSLFEYGCCGAPGCVRLSLFAKGFCRDSGLQCFNASQCD